MIRHLRSVALAGLFVFSAWGAAQAQQAPPIQQSASRLDAGTIVFAPTAAINQAQTTITLPAMSGLCQYVDSLLVGVGQDATGNTSATGRIYTTTNLGGLGWTFWPLAIATVPSMPNMVQQLIGAAPLKAPACGVAATIVSPAQQANTAYPMAVYAHYAP